MKGNEAMAEAAIRAGCKAFFGYPITPQTELSAYMAKYMEKSGGVFLQAESEVAAINMVYGASASGQRAMTSSSSPGISLKAEGISYLAGSDLPAVIINVQRGGPGLGSIQPAQQDYWQATHAMGHGDFHILVFAPASVQEMVDLIIEAFDTADEYRMPAMILADGLLGQMMEPVSFPDEVKIDKVDKSGWACSGHNMQREHHIVNSLYIEAGLCRPITLWPFPKKELNEAVKNASDVLCVEMSMGQMVDDVRLAINCSKPVHFFGRCGGVIPSPKEVLEEIKKLAGGKQ